MVVVLRKYFFYLPLLCCGLEQLGFAAGLECGLRFRVLDAECRRDAAILAALQVRHDVGKILYHQQRFFSRYPGMFARGGLA